MKCVDITRLKKKSGNKLSHECKERSTLKTNEVCDSSFKKKRDHELLTECKENALRKSLRHCLHRRGFICNRIGFDAVTPFVYTAPVEFVNYQNRVVLNTLSKVERFQNDAVSRPCKRRNRIDLKTFWSEIGWLAK